jgi:hypothetical protein
MNILRRLFEPGKRPARCAIVVGNGRFDLYVASTAQQRMELERLYGGRTGDPHRFPALLVPQPNNARGRNTVAVRVGETTVGYLHHTTALEFLAALLEGHLDRAACGAMIAVRPDPRLGNQAFRLRLDAEVPLKLADPANKETSDRKDADIGHKSGLGSAA